MRNRRNDHEVRSRTRLTLERLEDRLAAGSLLYEILMSAMAGGGHV